MKNLSIIFFLTIFSLNATGQVWVDAGATWHYDFWNVGYSGFYKYEYVQDTVIENHNCQKIAGESYAFTHNQYGNTVVLFHHVFDDQYTYVSGDTVFYRNNGAFFVLYNFGASIGDQWVISTSNPGGMCDDTSRVEVTDTGTITINSVAYRFITLQPASNAPFGLKGTYIERFGNIDSSFAPFQYLFPYGYQCDSLAAMVEWDYIKFKCFEDSSCSLYNPSTQECEYDLTHLGINESGQKDYFCYPNPTSGLINLNNAFPDDQLVEIYNYQGCLVRTFKMNHSSMSIDLSDLKSGIYFLHIKSQTGKNKVQKIIKE